MAEPVLDDMSEHLLTSEDDPAPPAGPHEERGSTVMPGSPRPPYESYVDALLAVLARPELPPERTVLTTADRTVDARALRTGIHRAARLLAAHGVTRASTVALLTGNHPETLIARYGANLLGARVVHLSPTAPPRRGPGSWRPPPRSSFWWTPPRGTCRPGPPSPSG